MFAKNLEQFLGQHLQASEIGPDGLAEVAARFESLRSYGHIPRGRENRARHLEYREIAAALLGLVPSRPAWAGHTATVLKNLVPVGGCNASCWRAANLLAAIQTILADDAARVSLFQVNISDAEAGTNAHGLASVAYKREGVDHTVWFVSKDAVTLSAPGAETLFDPAILRGGIARSLSLDVRFFTRLAKVIDDSLVVPGQPAGDGSEYDAQEAEQKRLSALGVTGRSHFLTVGVDTQVTWPRQEKLAHFDRYRLVLLPKTREHTQSVHVDLAANHLTDDQAMTVINRFLSMLAWCDDQFAMVQYGWSGNPVPVPVRKRDLAFATAYQWDLFRSIPAEDKARRALGLYREGLNAEQASLSSYAVLSFFKVLELGYRETDRVKKWIGRTFPFLEETYADDSRMKAFVNDRGTASSEDYIWEACRLAVAHASVRRPTDADDAQEIRRLSAASYVLQISARRFISERYQISESPFADAAEMR